MQAKITIQNVVAAVNVNQNVDLNKIVEKFPEVKYTPEVFPGLVFRVDKPKSCMLIFRTGKMVCTGTKNPKEAQVAAMKAIRKLTSAGIMKKSVQLEFSVQNIVAKVDLGDNKVDIENVFDFLPKYGRVLYEPEMFPGAIYYPNDSKVVFLIFHQGKLVCVGAKEEEEIQKAVGKLQIILEQSNLLIPARP